MKGDNHTKMIKPVEKGQFRYQVNKEDLVKFDFKVKYEFESGVDEGIVGLDEGLRVYKTFNPLIRFYGTNVRVDNLLASTTNFRSLNKIEKAITGIIHGLLLINRGIDTYGINNLAGFVKRNYAWNCSITEKELALVIDKLKNEDHFKIIQKRFPDRMKDKRVFFPEDTNLTPSQKRTVVNYIATRFLKLKRNELIGAGISVLEEKDDYTEINHSRIAKQTGLERRKISRGLTVRQKKLIEDLNLSRFFKNESTTKKFLFYLEDYDRYMSTPVKDIRDELGISYKTFDKFFKIVNEELEIVEGEDFKTTGKLTFRKKKKKDDSKGKSKKA